MLDPILGWTIAGVAVAAAGAGVPFLIRYLDRKAETTANKPAAHAALRRSVRVEFFPHASERALLQTTNMGATPVAINGLLISADARSKVTPELYPKSASILPASTLNLPAYIDIKRFFNDHLSERYRSGQEQGQARLSLALRCERMGQVFDTDSLRLIGSVEESNLVGVTPEKRG